MEEYTFLRQLADSWGVLVMTSIFFGICVWAYRPGSRKTHDEIASSIFRDDTAPAGAEGSVANRTEA